MTGHVFGGCPHTQLDSCIESDYGIHGLAGPTLACVPDHLKRKISKLTKWSGTQARPTREMYGKRSLNEQQILNERVSMAVLTVTM